MWRHRSARAVTAADRLLVAALAGIGIAAVLRLADWWFRAAHIGQPVLFVMLSLAFWYAVSRIVLGWVNYAALAKPEARAARPGQRVAIFTTSTPGEPLSMFDRTLAACRRVRYPHTTYLL